MKKTTLTSLDKGFIKDRLSRISRAGFSINTLNDVLSEIAVHEDNEIEMDVLSPGAKYTVQDIMGMLGELIHHDALEISRRFKLEEQA